MNLATSLPLTRLTNVFFTPRNQRERHLRCYVKGKMHKFLTSFSQDCLGQLCWEQSSKTALGWPPAEESFSAPEISDKLVHRKGYGFASSETRCESTCKPELAGRHGDLSHEPAVADRRPGPSHSACENEQQTRASSAAGTWDRPVASAPSGFDRSVP